MSEEFRKPSHKLTKEDAVQIWIGLWRGDFRHRLAARFDVNVARIYDVRDRKLHPESEAIARRIWIREKRSPPPEIKRRDDDADGEPFLPGL